MSNQSYMCLSTTENTPINSYLEKILNAKVYEAAIETPLQYARNLSLSYLWLNSRFLIWALKVTKKTFASIFIGS